jgi:hypothetical protein
MSLQDQLITEAGISEPINRGTKTLEEQVKYNFTSFIRINIMNFKYRC